MEVIKSVTEEGNKFYLIEVLYMKGNKSFYPYFSGYYASGMPIELKEGVDEDSPTFTYQDIEVAYDEYEALSLLMITEDNNDDNRKLAEEMVNEKIKAALVNEIEKFIKEEEEMEKMISENKNGFGWYGNMDEMNRRDGFLKNGNGKGDITKCKYYVKPSNVTFADIAGLLLKASIPGTSKFPILKNSLVFLLLTLETLPLLNVTIPEVPANSPQRCPILVLLCIAALLSLVIFLLFLLNVIIVSPFIFTTLNPSLFQSLRFETPKFLAIML